jgi:hypothetical protein
MGISKVSAEETARGILTVWEVDDDPSIRFRTYGEMEHIFLLDETGEIKLPIDEVSKYDALRFLTKGFYVEECILKYYGKYEILEKDFLKKKTNAIWRFSVKNLMPILFSKYTFKKVYKLNFGLSDFRFIFWQVAGLLLKVIKKDRI